MPAKTPKQHRAMAAAAAGKSTLGIPQKVGREFMKAGIPNHKQPMSPKPKVSTGGTVGAAVGSNPEYRHDMPYKSRNPQTRGTKKTGYETGHGSRNKQTPGNYYVQDGAMKMQKCMVYQMRGNSSAGKSSAEMKGGKYHNPHRGGY